MSTVSPADGSGESAAAASNKPMATMTARPSTRGTALKALTSGEGPELAELRYLICFSATTTDPHDHSTNWVCMDSSQQWDQIEWVKTTHTMSVQERCNTVTVKTTTPDGQATLKDYRTFARVEFGKLTTD